MKSAGLAEIREVRISGGGAKSSLWRQILADVIKVELVTVNTTEGAAYGAALLAGVAAGVWSDVVVACQTTVKRTDLTTPRPRPNASYEQIYKLYRQIYPRLKTISHLLSDL